MYFLFLRGETSCSGSQSQCKPLTFSKHEQEHVDSLLYVMKPQAKKNHYE